MGCLPTVTRREVTQQKESSRNNYSGERFGVRQTAGATKMPHDYALLFPRWFPGFSEVGITGEEGRTERGCGVNRHGGNGATPRPLPHTPALANHSGTMRGESGT